MGGRWSFVRWNWKVSLLLDEVKTVEPPSTTTRKVSPKAGGILSRIGTAKEELPKKRNVKARLGGSQEGGTARSIQSRLGLVDQRRISPNPTGELNAYSYLISNFMSPDAAR